MASDLVVKKVSQPAASTVERWAFARAEKWAVWMAIYLADL